MFPSDGRCARYSIYFLLILHTCNLISACVCECGSFHFAIFISWFWPFSPKVENSCMRFKVKLETVYIRGLCYVNEYTVSIVLLYLHIHISVFYENFSHSTLLREDVHFQLDTAGDAMQNVNYIVALFYCFSLISFSDRSGFIPCIRCVL